MSHYARPLAALVDVVPQSGLGEVGSKGRATQPPPGRPCAYPALRPSSSARDERSRFGPRHDLPIREGYQQCLDPLTRRVLCETALVCQRQKVINLIRQVVCAHHRGCTPSPRVRVWVHIEGGPESPQGAVGERTVVSCSDSQLQPVNAARCGPRAGVSTPDG